MRRDREARQDFFPVDFSSWCLAHRHLSRLTNFINERDTPSSCSNYCGGFLSAPALPRLIPVQPAVRYQFAIIYTTTPSKKMKPDGHRYQLACTGRVIPKVGLGGAGWVAAGIAQGTYRIDNFVIRRGDGIRLAEDITMRAVRESISISVPKIHNAYVDNEAGHSTIFMDFH